MKIYDENLSESCQIIASGWKLTVVVNSKKRFMMTSDDEAAVRMNFLFTPFVWKHFDKVWLQRRIFKLIRWKPEGNL